MITAGGAEAVIVGTLSSTLPDPGDTLTLSMIDIHDHLLPALDDGAVDLETSLAMARIAVEDGITHIVCTPHANGQYPYDRAANETRVADLRDSLAQHNIPITLGLGCDFHMSYDNIQDAKADPARFSINGLGYLLAELPDYGIPQGLTETFYELQLAGLTPVLTHPERNATLQNDFNRLSDWLRGGLLIQVTAGSVLGHMGKTAERVAHALLAKRWVHILATDAHNTAKRPPRMREARDLVAKKFGADYAEQICSTNPLSAFNGTPLAEQSEPESLYDNLKPRSWWQRLTQT